MKINNLVSSFKFAKAADIVFSGVFLKTQINNLKIENFNTVHKFDEFLYIRNKEFEIRENDTVFCKTEDIKLLFSLISKLKFKNIQIITHQSDLPIDYKIFSQKPNCVSKWFGININHHSSELISIPIGIANEHPKNLKESEFLSKKINIESYFRRKNNMLYLNFQKSTNFKSRTGLYEIYENYNWVNVDSPFSNKTEYSKNLQDSEFVLAPFGNGFDTHRVWEALYSGSIPIVEKHIAYSYAEELPVLFVDSLFSIDKNLLKMKKADLKNKQLNLLKLDFEYWSQLISIKKVSDSKSIKIINKGFRTILFEINYKIKFKINSKTKILFYYLRKLRSFKKSYFIVFRK